MNHPELMTLYATERHRELISQADRYRLLASARRARRGRRRLANRSEAATAQPDPEPAATAQVDPEPAATAQVDPEPAATAQVDPEPAATAQPDQEPATVSQPTGSLAPWTQAPDPHRSSPAEVAPAP